MAADSKYIPRILNPPKESFFLLGPRGTGKSTWLLHQYPDAVRIDLLLGEEERRFGTYPECRRIASAQIARILRKVCSKWTKYLATIFSMACLLVQGEVYACTGIVQKAENGDWVYARTMEFGVDILTYNLLLVPRGTPYTSSLSVDKEGAKWKTKYTHVGFNPAGNSILIDGLNEKGLACGGFYFPGYACYEELSEQELPHTISNIDFVSWVLGNFSTVKEVREALTSTKVVGVLFAEWNIVPPMHYIVVDETGEKIVIEYVGRKQKIYDAWIGTITNAPTYDWHLNNMRNYTGLTALNRPAQQINEHTLTPFGQGSGALGLPGDFTPPSRFVRATFFNYVVLPGKNGQEQVQRAFKILNQFDIPKGAVRDEKEGVVHYEETQWTSASDLKGRRYFFHSLHNRAIQVVDLSREQGTHPQTIPIDSPEVFIELP